jgi:hypothetical protein
MQEICSCARKTKTEPIGHPPAVCKKLGFGQPKTRDAGEPGGGRDDAEQDSVREIFADGGVPFILR